MVQYADNYASSTSDIGTQINAAYAALPSTGGIIVIPAGSYSFSNEIAITTAGKTAMIECAPGGQTTLTYTGTATSTIFNAAGLTSGHRYGWGMIGCRLVGPGTAGNEGTTAGIELGGATGAEGVTIYGVRLQHFGIGLYEGNNTWATNVDESGFSDANKAVVFGGTSNSGERLNFTNSVFFNNDSTLFNSPGDHCVDLGNNLASANFTNDSFDYCQLYVGTGDLSVNVTGGHFENPWSGSGTGEGTSPYVYVATSTASMVRLSNLVMMNDATTTGNNPVAFIMNYGGVQAANVSLNKNGSQTVANFISNNQDFEINNLYVGQTTAVTNLVNNIGFPATGNGATIDYVGSKGNSYPQGFTTSSGNVMQFYNGGNAGAKFDSNNFWYFPQGWLSVGTSTATANVTLANNSANATTTVEIGLSGQTKGDCLKWHRTDGSPIYVYVAAGATVWSLSTTANICSNVAGF
jgi:hypothetical protein